MSYDCMELVSSSFVTVIKKYDTGGKVFQPILLKYWPRACCSMLRRGEESFGARLVVELLLLVIASTVIPCILQGLALRPPAESKNL